MDDTGLAPTQATPLYYERNRVTTKLSPVKICVQARRQGGSVASDEPPWLPNGPLEVFRKLIFWPLLTPPIAVTSSVELKTAVIRLRTASFLGVTRGPTQVNLVHRRVKSQF